MALSSLALKTGTITHDFVPNGKAVDAFYDGDEKKISWGNALVAALVTGGAYRSGAKNTASIVKQETGYDVVAEQRAGNVAKSGMGFTNKILSF